ncbi:branched-chain amino acid ABC transporter permease [Aureimonas endophytica]|uniref:Branched-chain amino acid ABC transporter permease n=1 Tax=Aureimonas endophytica TaxID=2027858 RepID=A0A916ZFH1_9HYPH|nr:AzlC family ABC transporter permease [Aureimonas endophytica]GGD92200.1 branched-chain amino acid ABC transporter permease [Aureimonas endophytica]
MSQSHEARAGLREVLPLLFVILPFGAIFGTYALQSGLTLGQTLGFGGLIYAGASQLVALQMMSHGAPLWSAVLAIFALNFRHVLYSASIGRHLTRFSAAQKALAFFLLVDPSFGAAEARVAKAPLTRTFYFTYAVALYATWVLSCWLGYEFGRLIRDPHDVALDFILPVYFLALVTDFRSRANFLPVAVISALASGILYATVGSPWHVTVGGLAGIAYAASVKPKQPKDVTP